MQAADDVDEREILVVLILTRLIGSCLFGVTPTDPLTLASVSALLMLVTLTASYWLARRAASIVPASVLRSE